MDNEVLMEIKPTFNRWKIETIEWLQAVPFVSICVFPVLFIAISLERFQPANVTWGLYFFTLCVFGLFWVKFWSFLVRKNYDVTVYKTYRDRIEFEEGFINHKYTVIKMADIKEIRLTQNFLQRKVRLGTISFVTAANTYPTATGICFKDIENSADVYAEIKQLHEDCAVSKKIEKDKRGSR
ncbi:MAG: PH domain-containing protein [Alphaproteobacteria bacterium]|nr:PH domain-containing protein [Alphaproteobacteria bacterium]